MKAVPTIVGSYTLFRDEENCPRKAYHRFVARDLPREEPTPQLEWGNDVHEALERRLARKAPLPPEMSHFEPYAVALDAKLPQVEGSLGMREDGSACGFFDPDVYLRGKVDVLVRDPETAVIIDCKTGKQREDPLELEIFGLLVQAKYPNITRLVGHYVWLADNELGQCYDLSNTLRTWGSIQGRMNALRYAQNHNFWPPRQNPLCGWCPVTSCEFNRRGK